MTIESITYISDLNLSLPANTDSLSEKDDHIRNLKKALKNTFPSATVPITITQAQLNSQEGAITALESQMWRKDGSLVATNHWSMTGHRVANVQAPVSGQDGIPTWWADQQHSTNMANTLQQNRSTYYPVGSVVISAYNSTPASSWGFPGTWTSHGYIVWGKPGETQKYIYFWRRTA